MAIMTEQPVGAAQRRTRSSRDRMNPVRPAAPGRWTLGPGELAEVPVTRRAMTAWLRDRGVRTGDLDAAELVIGELLANAVEHTAGPARVTLEWSGTWPKVRVTDFGAPTTDPLPAPATKHPALPGDTFAESGRGLALVSMLARHLVLGRTATGGVEVTATLALTR